MEGAMATNIKHLLIVQEKAFKQKQRMSKQPVGVEEAGGTSH